MVATIIFIWSWNSPWSHLQVEQDKKIKKYREREKEAIPRKQWNWGIKHWKRLWYSSKATKKLRDTYNRLEIFRWHPFQFKNFIFKLFNSLINAFWHWSSYIPHPEIRKSIRSASRTRKQVSRPPVRFLFLPKLEPKCAGGENLYKFPIVLLDFK